ncbi:MAG: hypothetical protein H7Y86_20480 [Rhizobacter sp.]|nr:hypothetical protein [Ferruginibacter sp.]
MIYFFNNAAKLIDSGSQIKTDFVSNDLLKSAKQRRYIQQKWSGITAAGEFYTGVSNKHYFAYFEKTGLLIDFTDNINYWLKSK